MLNYSTPNLQQGGFGLNKILFTHRNHKLNKQVQETQKQYAYLSVTYIYIYKMTITQTPTIARWQIIVKTSEATKQTKDQNDSKKQTNKQTNKLVIVSSV